MNSSNEQAGAEARPRSGATRQRLLNAAVALIAEVGWGRVTTRAVAERAGLPLGTVSYHFRGKQELLTQAALHAVEHVFPLSELAAVESLSELLGMIRSSLAGGDAVDPGLSAVLMEAMRESSREPVLRERMATLLGEYRRVLAELVQREQQRSAVHAGMDPAALATLIIAVGDGLLLHGALEPELDVSAAMTALNTLLWDDDHDPQ